MFDDREETSPTGPLRKGRVRRNRRAVRSLRPGNPPVEALPPTAAKVEPPPPPQPPAARPKAAARSPRPAEPQAIRRLDVSAPANDDVQIAGRSNRDRPDAIADSPEGSIPLQNVPLLSMKLGRWTVDGYSRAAVQSYWRIGEMKLGFDVGAHPWDFTGLPRLFITHAHLDHIAALPVYIARRRMMKMEPPVIYLPKASVDAAAAMLRLFTQLDRGRLPCELIGVTPGDEIEISREYTVTASPTRHTVPSVAYLVWEKRRKLKPEFADLTTDEIRDLRLAGTEVAAEVRLPAVGYTGDTAPAGLDECPDLYRAELLITEMTFLAPDHRREKIHKHGHMHLDDYVVRRDRFENDHIVCMHFSTRYHDEQCLRWFDRAFPDRLGGRMIPWLASKRV